MLFNLKNNYFTERYYSFFYNTKASYYNRFLGIVDVDDLIHKAGNNTEYFFSTDTEIQAFNLPFDILPDNLLKRFGKPHFYKNLSKNSSFKTVAYFYKKNFFKNEAVIQFTFINNILVYCMITFLTENDSDEKIFLKIISEKYFDSEFSLSGRFSGIKDSLGNCIVYEKGVYSSLIYINNSPAIKAMHLEEERRTKLISLQNWQKHYNMWSDSL